jgi:hypothetical protein
MLGVGSQCDEAGGSEMSESDEMKEDVAEDLELDEVESEQVDGGLKGIKGETQDSPNPWH